MTITIEKGTRVRSASPGIKCIGTVTSTDPDPDLPNFPYLIQWDEIHGRRIIPPVHERCCKQEIVVIR